jgi:hypothetical protein
MLLELPPDASVADAYIAVAAERSLPSYQIKLIALWTRMGMGHGFKDEVM